MTSYISTDELWEDLVDSVTSRHLKDPVTMRELDQNLDAADEYIVRKLQVHGGFYRRDVLERVAEYLNLPRYPTLIKQAEDEIVAMSHIMLPKEIAK